MLAPSGCPGSHCGAAWRSAARRSAAQHSAPKRWPPPSPWRSPAGSERRAGAPPSPCRTPHPAPSPAPCSAGPAGGRAGGRRDGSACGVRHTARARTPQPLWPAATRSPGTGTERRSRAAKLIGASPNKAGAIAKQLRSQPSGTHTLAGHPRLLLSPSMQPNSRCGSSSRHSRPHMQPARHPPSHAPTWRRGPPCQTPATRSRSSPPCSPRCAAGGSCPE